MREKEREASSRRQKRKDSQIRMKEKERDTASRGQKRKDSQIRMKEKERDTASRRQKRKDSQIRMKEQERDTTSRRQKRTDNARRHKERQTDTASKRRRRALPASLEKAIMTFKEKISEGPSYICTSCNRLLYRHSVVEYKASSYADVDQDLLSSCRTSKLSHDMKEYICSTCRNSLLKNDLPLLSCANGFQTEEVPYQLQDLNTLEAVFISRRIPFMKILALPRGQQKAVHGCVVNIPIEPEQSISVLPRVPSSDAFIAVKLKRKLMYRGHVYLQNIRPQKILEALHTLKFVLKNPLYEDVIVSEDWQRRAMETDENLWKSLTGNCTNEDEENSEEVEAEDEAEVEDERTRLSGIPYDSCIQPKDIVADSNVILNFAPGENKKPMSFHSDEHSEEMSFPKLFPSGKFGFSMRRERKISLRRYFQARILNCDTRFAGSIEYLFYAQYRCEVKDIKDSLSMSLRKGKQKSLTAGEIKVCLSDFIRHDLGIHFLQKIRGSPAYFNKLFYDLLGMIRHLGPCTWFITLSAADLKWADTLQVIAQQQGVTLTRDDVDSLTWEEKSKYLRSNAVTAARHFDNRVQNFLKYILLNPDINPLGTIIDYKFRIEFQLRGSPHVHMLAWVKDAPSLDRNSNAEIEHFIDDKVTCQLPVNDPELTQLVDLVQHHSHSVACRKHGEKCRFQFPRPPMRKTTVFRPLEEPPTKSMKDMYADILSSVYTALENTDCESVEQLLENAEVTEKQYLDALHWMHTKNGQPAVLLQRSPKEAKINNYNPTIMRSWEANHDVQFVTNVYSCVMYLASYISKPEKTLGDVLKAVSSSSQHLGAKISMRSVAQKFLTHREVSAQEAVYRLLSLPLTQGSRQVIFLDTDLPENRTRLFKPIKVLQCLEDDDQDVYMHGMIDRYAARPNTLEDMCLCEFASKYKTATKPQHNDARASQKSTEVDDTTRQYITLKKGLGRMILREKPAIVRYHQWSLKNQPEQYYHSQLFLYIPWREETNDLLHDSYKSTYQSQLEHIQHNRRKFEHFAEEVTDVLEDIQENGICEESWVTVAPETEQTRLEEETEGAQEEAGIMDAFDFSTLQTASAKTDTGSTSFQYQMVAEKVSMQDWVCHILSLNEKQYQLHQFIVDWATRLTLSHRIPKPQPFHVFLTGGAGVGKSHLVRAIVQTANRIFSVNSQGDETHVLVCAPTGAAAYNVSGYTCHAAFLLPLHTKKTDDYISLSSEKLAVLKETFNNIKLIIIDEISMVGADTLLLIHRRLCDIMGNTDPFGGLSILAVGDLLQLSPVAQKPVFDVPSDEMSAIYGSLWKTHFQVVELTEIERQKNDEQFASLLNRIRIGEQTEEDIQKLNSRQVSQTDISYPLATTHIFAYNKDVSSHNQDMLKSLPTTQFTFKAKDSKRDEQTRRVEYPSFPEMAGGLRQTLVLAVGARVILTKNLDVSDGLVNSAAGTVTGFLPHPPDNPDDQFHPKYVLVQFDDTRIGKQIREQSKSILPHLDYTPIPTVEVPVCIAKSSKITAKRTQFPLTHPWGLTIHKEQGKTESSIVLSCKGSFHAGQFYTAVSRTTTLNGLHILDEVSCNKIKVNSKSLEEMKRMSKDARFLPPVPSSLEKSPCSYIKLNVLNINSLNAHYQSLLKDGYIQRAHITCLIETWLIPSDHHPDIPQYNPFRTDRANRHQGKPIRGGGLLMYIKQELYLVKEYSVPDIDLEYQMVILSPKEDMEVRIAIINIYNIRTTTPTQSLCSIERLISALPLRLHTIIMGDFNIDVSKESVTSKNLLSLMKYYVFHLLSSSPTHRRGGCIDHIYTNIIDDDIAVNTVPVYYSDHLLLSAAIPKKCLL